MIAAELALASWVPQQLTEMRHLQTIRDAMEKDKGRVTADLNSFFGHKPGPAVVGDMDGKFLESES